MRYVIEVLKKDKAFCIALLQNTVREDSVDD